MKTKTQDFTLASEPLPGHPAMLLTLSGELDAHTCERLDAALSALFSQGHYQLIVDLARLNYVSSAGAGVFIGALLEAQEHEGTIVLLKPAPGVREVFELLGLSLIFKIADDMKTAQAAV